MILGIPDLHGDHQIARSHHTDGRLSRDRSPLQQVMQVASLHGGQREQPAHQDGRHCMHLLLQMCKEIIFPLLRLWQMGLELNYIFRSVVRRTLDIGRLEGHRPHT